MTLMITLARRFITPTAVRQATRALSSAPGSSLTQAEILSENNAARAALEAEKSSVEKYVEATREIDPTMVWGTTIAPPDPDLPEDVSEIAALDPSHANQDPLTLTGETRVVHIKQEQAKVNQGSKNPEKQWVIAFGDEGETGQCWDNSLMGWVSSSDTMSSNMGLQMSFRNAADAMYFAKKRGWEFIIDKPIMRKGRDDDAQYQDNFLPQAVSGRVRREKKSCDQWSRSEAGSSHYFRPLKYHGIGTVPQHGPNSEDDIAPHSKGYYKLR